MKKILNSFLESKKYLPLVLVAVFLLTFIPLHYAYAWPWDALVDLWNWIQTLPLKILVMILAGVIFIIMLTLGFIYYCLATVLTWLIGVTLQIGITPGGANNTPPIITQSWGFTKDLVSMIFILILVFIGLATVLRIREYEAKKLLPLLILMTILINFSGVIVGFVVDISNIVTNFFVDSIVADGLNGLEEVWSDASGYIGDAIQNTFLNFGDWQSQIGDALGTVVYGISLIVFYLFALLVFFVLCLLFLVRVLILWLLVILAPVAFGCYILPATKKFWNQWWQQLIQWSIIGIPIGFFLYISDRMMDTEFFGTDPNIGNMGGAMSSAQSSMAEIIGKILAPSMGLFFLAIGIMVSMTFVPQGASGIISWGKKTGMAAGRWAGRTARQSRPVAATEGAIRKRMENIPVVNRLSGFRPGDYEAGRAKRIEDEKKFISSRQDTDEGNKAIWNRINRFGANESEITAGLHTLAERNAIPEDIQEQAKLNTLISRVKNKAGFNQKTILKSRADLADRFDFKINEKDAAGNIVINPATGMPNKINAVTRQEKIDAAISKIEAADFAKSAGKRSLNDEDVILATGMDERFVELMSRNAKPENKAIYNNKVQEILNTKYATGLLTAEQEKRLETIIDTMAKNPTRWS